MKVCPKITLVIYLLLTYFVFILCNITKLCFYKTVQILWRGCFFINESHYICNDILNVLIMLKCCYCSLFLLVVCACTYNFTNLKKGF